jgi:glycosyltransferase involved in cell wall biosynthesis
MPARLLLLNTDLLRGGTPTVVRELAVRLRRAGVDVEVTCLSTWGPVADELRDAGVPTVALDATARDVTVIPRLTRLIRDRRYTTVLSFLMHANAAAAAASLRIGRSVRWVQSIQTTQPDPWWHWPVQRLAQRAGDAVGGPSPSAARGVVIPNAIDPADWPPTTGARPADIVFLGRLDPVKDVPTLVAAVALLVPDHRSIHPNKAADGIGGPAPTTKGPPMPSAALLDGVHLHVYGDGPDRPRIERAVAAHRVADHVTLHGTVARPQAALAHAGVLVLSSLAEGFGLVLIEAMATGVPVVATDVPGVRDVVRQGVTGLLVPPGDPAAMAAAIRRLIGDPPLRAQLAAAAGDDVRRRFTWAAMLPQYRQLLRV